MTYPAEVLADSPLAYWRLAEASGTAAADASGNGRTGTYAGGVTLSQGGALADGDPAAAFDGATNTQMTRTPPPTTATANVTVECWAYLAALPTTGCFVNVGEDDGYGLGVGATQFDASGSNLVGLYGQRRWIPTGHALHTGWNHLALVVNASGQPQLYHDGVSVYTDTGAAPAAPTGSLHAGGFPGRWFAGRLDEVAVYGTALSAARLLAHYTASGGPLTFTAGAGTNDAADTLLYEPAPTTNFQTYAGWEIGAEPGGAGRRERVVARFDLSALPAGATITGATLRLQPRAGFTYKVEGAPTVKLYALLAANSDWAVAQATWNARRTATAWAGAAGCGLAGTDYQTTELGSSSAFVHGTTAPVDIALSTSVVAGWLTANYGFLVRGADETTAGVRVFDIASANDSTPAVRPRLTLLYTPPPAPAAAQRWTGSAWTTTAVKRWDGSAWQPATVKRWDGAGWV